MQIGIDMSLTAMAKHGLPSYARSLVAALARIDKRNEYVLYPYAWHSFPPEYWKAFCPKQSNFRLAGSRLPRSVLEKMWDHPRADRGRLMKLGSPDVYFSPFHSTPEQHFRRLVSVFHDIAFRIHPEFSTEENRNHCEVQWARATAMADIMITVSHFSKSEMVKHMGASPDWIRVTHEAADPMYRPIENARLPGRILEGLGGAKDFILYVGSVEPRKNLKTLVEALARMRERTKSSVPLVIAGGSGWKNSEVFDEIERRGLKGQVYFTGYVSDDELIQLYNCATVFVYPTIYEGFGLPVIEAMSTGVPVITTRVASIPEVGGAAVAYVDDPMDTVALSERLQELLEDARLRDRMRQAGLDQAATFSWERCAKETLAVLEEAHTDPKYSRSQVRIGQDERGLARGWNNPEVEGPRAFRWSERSGKLQLRPPAGGARQLTLEASTSFPGGEQVLAVRVNGRTIGRMSLPAEWTEQTFEIPQDLPNGSDLQISLDVNFDLPRSFKGGDPRELGAKISKVILA